MAIATMTTAAMNMVTSFATVRVVAPIIYVTKKWDTVSRMVILGACCMVIITDGYVASETKGLSYSPAVIAAANGSNATPEPIAIP